MEVQNNHVLNKGTVLAGRYRIEKCIGEGGFGITYLGIDTKLDMPVAVKEYYPTGHVTRESNSTTNVTVFSGDSASFFEKDRNRFLSEAKTLARFSNLPGIVSVSDFFDENSTSYIVMEYIDGITLLSYLQQNGGRISVAETLEKMRPVMDSLAEIHYTGMIHRDISPDNIMITKRGELKLIDFGTAREVTAGQSKSLSVMLKPGYAPEEQYRSHGNQGPWTDVYAICATIYRCIAGTVPLESLDRLAGERLKDIREFNLSLPENIASAIMKGLSLKAVDRYQNMKELGAALYGNQQVAQIAQAQPVAQSVTEMPQARVAQAVPVAKAITEMPQERVAQALPVAQSVTEMPQARVAQAVPVAKAITEMPQARVAQAVPVAQTVTSAPQTQVPQARMDMSQTQIPSTRPVEVAQAIPVAQAAPMQPKSDQDNIGQNNQINGFTPNYKEDNKGAEVAKNVIGAILVLAFLIFGIWLVVKVINVNKQSMPTSQGYEIEDFKEEKVG